MYPHHYIPGEVQPEVDPDWIYNKVGWQFIVHPFSNFFAVFKYNKNARRTIYWGYGLDLKGDTTTYSIQKF